MDIAVAPLVAEKRSTRCRICGRTAPRGAKLCGQCVAAVKRARQVPTVSTQFMPLTTSRVEPVAPKMSPRAPQPRASLRSWVSTKAGGWGVIVAFAVFGVAICATAYFAVQEIDQGADQVGVAPPVPAVAPADVRVAPAVEPVPTEVLTTPVEADNAARAEIDLVPQTTAIAPPGPPTPKQTLNSRKPRKAAVMPVESRLANQIGDEGPQPVAAEQTNDAPAPSNVIQPAIADGPPAPDRWDRMNAALALCARESFVAGVVCTERARMQYCEGHWGEVPQCRGAARPGTAR